MAVIVLYTTHKFTKNETSTGGIKRFLELLYGLVERENIIYLFCPVDANLRSHPNIIRYNINSKTIKCLPPSIALFLSNYRIIKDRIKNINYDAVVAMDVPYVLQLALMRIPRVICMLRQDFVECRLISNKSRFPKSRKIYSFILILAELIALKGAHRILVQSGIYLDNLIKRHPKIEDELKSKTVIIPNNVNPSWIKDYKVSSNIWAAKNGANIFTICFIGNVNKLKGLEILLGAVEKLINMSYSVRLLVVGDGENLPAIRNKYEKFKNIVFLGKTNKAIDILIGSDLLVVPSIIDAFPNTIMEALFYEVPVIGSNRGGIPEMLKYQELIFEPHPDILAKKLKSIIDDNLLENLKSLCLKRKEKYSFNWVREIENAIVE